MTKTKTHTAIAKCNDCNRYIISPGGGRFVRCTCGNSFIDQERFGARYVRTSRATLIEQICPTGCTEHPDNKQIDGTAELDAYLETYKNNKD